MTLQRAALAAGFLFMSAMPALAAEGLDGRTLGLPWAIPFLGMLLSIAIFPLVAHDFWHHHRGKVAAFWALLALIPIVMTRSLGTAGEALVHTALMEYIPFILLLLALFTVAGGIVVRGNLHGSPATNTAILAIGAALASIIGTTGAAMIMIRPLLRANDDRKHNVHVFVFFIFLVANAGGALTPLGDPPLFLGFLRGVSFFWPTVHLLLPALLIVGVLLALFFVMDSIIYRKEGHLRRDPTPDGAPVRVVGGINFLLIAAIIATILLSASFDLGDVVIFGTHEPITALLRDAAFIAIVGISLALTPAERREANKFDWEPIKEVAQLFAGIFITIIPVLAMLKTGTGGVFAPLVELVQGPGGEPNNLAYFWITGGLSSFLDNAPTYLVFFELAGGDPQYLMTEGATTLAAISAGAVFMGANTYIGNAPNFMVYAMARDAGVKMPGFFGYMLWSSAILLPLFVVVGWMFFAG